jgi:hypothetical protein
LKEDGLKAWKRFKKKKENKMKYISNWKAERKIDEVTFQPLMELTITIPLLAERTLDKEMLENRSKEEIRQMMLSDLVKDFIEIINTAKG